MIEHIVITGGGTGGHLMVADAIINELHAQEKPAIFIGSKNGQDRQWFENKFQLHRAIFLDTKGVVNKNFFGKIQSMLNIFSKMFECIELFDKYNVKKVVSVGGYSAAAATMAAIVTRRELFIHEQNSVMGSLNKYSSFFAKYIFNSFDPKCEINAYPVKPEFFDTARIRKEIKKVIFLGGSQGALFINTFALKVAPKLNKMGIKIVHQTGKKDLTRVLQKYEELGIKAEVFDFTTDISHKMGHADLAVSRAGASTLWELTANALPTLFIPFPFAAKDHQYTNAKFLSNKGVAFLKREKQLTPEYFFEIIEKEDIHAISKKLVDAIMLDGVKMIVDKILAK
ncbi:MAG: UDP-N-acetylglucosamine--N-acetylmuramyl-(pentapeptide) pyrophosphoryl-undecaprenol N-acetylglucosamine transferase [Sphaerochaetaceae bacterium]|nr:UDP-N-acetylglucosamine--N-acetylmuramyl-(pentapeptide) pyrophosphoryl-undecaprenol N-acetylglucosamine transferase [Sphaerochaetaceae bacterium]